MIVSLVWLLFMDGVTGSDDMQHGQLDMMSVLVLAFVSSKA